MVVIVLQCCCHDHGPKVSAVALQPGSLYFVRCRHLTPALQHCQHYCTAHTPPLETLDVDPRPACHLQDDSSAFAQLTVRLQSTQRFAAYDARGRLLAGDPDAHFPVTDLWVFEMSLRKSVANRWRLAARLNPALK